MSETEKTHIVVILLAVFGGFVFLGCIVFAGLSFFIVQTPTMPPTNSPPVVATNFNNKALAPAFEVSQIVEQADGSYLVTLEDTVGQTQTLQTYEFKVLELATPAVSIKVLPRDPQSTLTGTVPTQLKLSLKKGGSHPKLVKIDFERSITGPILNQIDSGSIEIDLTKSQVGNSKQKRETPKAGKAEKK